MQDAQRWGKALLWFHLVVCVIWLCFFRSILREPPRDVPDWMAHVMAWSILGIQFTWGFTIGLLVGPSRKRRRLLWWSLLPAFLPLWFYGIIALIMGLFNFSPLLMLIYLGVFVMILGCETFCGVLLGAKAHGSAPPQD